MKTGLLTGPFRAALERAIVAAAPSLWLVPFRSPGRMPYPWLAFPEGDLRPGSLKDWAPLGPYHTGSSEAGNSDDGDF
jgi:hypothetical protein